MIKIALIALGMMTMMGRPASAQDANDNLVIASPSFSLLDEKLRKGTVGIPYGKLVSAILKSNPPDKSEYETKDEFDARVRKWEGKKLFGDVGTGNRIAVVVPAVTLPYVHSDEAFSTSYDAESENMSATLTLGFDCSGVMLSKSSKPKREYVATNSYGAKVKVLVALENRDCVQFGDGGKVKSADQSFAFKVPKKSAEATSYSIDVAVIGRITSPYAQIEKSHMAPTMRFPVEKEIITRTLMLNVDAIWLIHRGTGEVLAKNGG